MTEGSGETRLSDQIHRSRSLCDAATPGPWRTNAPERNQGDLRSKVIFHEREDGNHWALACFWDWETPAQDAVANAAFIAAHSPDVVSALLDVAEAAHGVVEFREFDGRDGSNWDVQDFITELASALSVLSQRMEERP